MWRILARSKLTGGLSRMVEKHMCIQYAKPGEPKLRGAAIGFGFGRCAPVADASGSPKPPRCNASEKQGRAKNRKPEGDLRMSFLVRLTAALILMGLTESFAVG